MIDYFANECPRCNSPREEFEYDSEWNWKCSTCRLKQRAPLVSSKERIDKQVIFTIEDSDYMHIELMLGRYIISWRVSENCTTIYCLDNANECIDVNGLLPFTLTEEDVAKYLLLK